MHATIILGQATLGMHLIAIIPRLNVDDHASGNCRTACTFLFLFCPLSLRKAFEVCGILSDVYVARNRNARGQNYGFVRYINVKDVAKLQKVLNNVFFGQNKVWENVACFDRFGEGEKINEGGLLDTEKEEMVLARKQALEQVKLNAKGSEEEREKVHLIVVVGDISYADFFKEKKISHFGHASKVNGGAIVTRKFHSDNDDVVWASKGCWQEC
ncbi:RNA recognition motif [Medicago truncatula]|uniref:RNA recognition motif n=1 Tax=Medicago truncatula TaxID=3880 RepID=A0A072V8S0_MEDTR|nr:RNA recognition motif [Medicago truncatula]